MPKQGRHQTKYNITNNIFLLTQPPLQLTDEQLESGPIKVDPKRAFFGFVQFRVGLDTPHWSL
jgi:hypothetical protein